MADRLTVVRERDFIGYNDTMAPEFLPAGFLADALNCFMRTGEIVKRKGYTLIANDLGSVGCQGLKGVRFANGTKELISVFNGVVYKWTGTGSWSQISGTYTLSTTAQVEIVIANNSLYFFDGTNTVPKYNGTTMSTVAAIPIGTIARWFHNQLHVAGMTNDGNALKSSVIGDPETFTGTTSSDIDVNPNDGDYIVGMHELSDELVIFKQNRIWSITGFGTTALTLNDFNEQLTGIGTLAHRSIVNTGNDLLYIGFLGDKPVIRSIKRTQYGLFMDAGSVSTEIETTMNGLNKAQLGKTAAIFDGRYAWFAVPNGASSTNNLVLTLDTTTLSRKYKGWTRHTGINASVFASFAIGTQPQLYFGEASADSKTYVFDTSTSNNGATINFSITSARYGGDRPEMIKKFQYLYASAKEVGDYDVTIDYSPDGFSYSNLGTLNLGGTGATFGTAIFDTSKFGATDVKQDRYTVPKSRHKYMQFKMYDDTATSSITIRNWELLYQVKKAPVDR